MPDAVSNTSPLLYLHRIGVFGWLPEMFEEIRVLVARSRPHPDSASATRRSRGASRGLSRKSPDPMRRT
jgi:hypothetical protein